MLFLANNKQNLVAVPDLLTFVSFGMDFRNQLGQKKKTRSRIRIRFLGGIMYVQWSCRHGKLGGTAERDDCRAPLLTLSWA